MINKKLTAIITVVEKDKKYLSDCIRTLFTSCKYAKIKLQLIIIENGTIINKKILNSFNYQILHLKSNLGFGKAINEGYNYVKTNWSIILAPDTKCNKNTIQSLINSSVNGQIAIIGPKIYYSDGSLDFSILPEPNLWNIFLEQSYLYKLLPNIFKHPFAYHKLYDKTQKVDGVASTFWLINSEIFRKLKGFDNRYFLFFDDSDFCRRIIEKKYQIIFQPKSSIIHYGHQSNSGIINGYHLLDGLFKYLSKYHSSFYTTFCFFIVYIGSLIRFIYWKLKSFKFNNYSVKANQYKEMVHGIISIFNQTSVRRF
jgi:GT2 family glycosyltransferase